MFCRITVLFLFTFVSSCSVMQDHGSFNREPAQKKELNCYELLNALYKEVDEKADLKKALVDLKLLKYSSKSAIVQHPNLDWINKVKISLNKSIKNWNNNKYPAFYIFSDEDVVPHAKQYFETVNSMVTPDMAVAPDATRNLDTINSWIHAYTSYQRDIQNLIEERISLQYNLSIIKKLKFENDIKEIKITSKRNGQFVSETVTLRKSDKDKAYYIKKLTKEIKDLDGTTLSNGRIKDRIIRQAMLNDMITILHREFEYGVKNTETPNPELIKELNRINNLLQDSQFVPATYGVYRITNKVFIRELIAMSKLDVAYKKFGEAPLLKLKEVVEAFIENRPVKKDPKEAMEEAIKEGILKRAYAKVTSITPKQAAIGTGVIVTAAVGAKMYFSVHDPEIFDIDIDNDHHEQLDRTKEEALEKGQDHTSVIEVHIDELTKQPAHQ